jgi:hypothetical protein
MEKEIIEIVLSENVNLVYDVEAKIWLIYWIDDEGDEFEEPVDFNNLPTIQKNGTILAEEEFEDYKAKIEAYLASQS